MHYDDNRSDPMLHVAKMVTLTPAATLAGNILVELGPLQAAAMIIFTGGYWYIKTRGERIEPFGLWLVMNLFPAGVLLWSLGGGTLQIFDSHMQTYATVIAVSWFVTSAGYLILLGILANMPLAAPARQEPVATSHADLPRRRPRSADASEDAISRAGGARRSGSIGEHRVTHRSSSAPSCHTTSLTRRMPRSCAACERSTRTRSDCEWCRPSYARARQPPHRGGVRH